MLAGWSSDEHPGSPRDASVAHWPPSQIFLLEIRKHGVFTRRMTGYTKLFSQIITSTIWQEPNDCRVLWITMLALQDANSVCAATVPALARLCNISVEDCEKHLEKFQQPDPYSRSQEHEGRRIERVEGGWLILNGQKYRNLLRSAERRDYIREKVREHRAKVKGCKQDVNSGKQSNQCKPKKEAEAYKQKNINTPLPPKGLPASVTPELWMAFESMRKSIKKPMTPKAQELIVKKLVKLESTGNAADAVLEQSIVKCWQDVFPLQQQFQQAGRPRPTNMGSTDTPPPRPLTPEEEAEFDRKARQRLIDVFGPEAAEELDQERTTMFGEEDHV